MPLVTVSSWENGQRKPSGAALKLLDIAERYPEIFVGHRQTGTGRIVAVKPGRARSEAKPKAARVRRVRLESKA